MILQLYFDIGTPSEVFKILNKKIEEHMEANSNELTGEFACCNFGCGDPMKMKLGVYFEYAVFFVLITLIAQ